jgi:hypothetical protein
MYEHRKRLPETAARFMVGLERKREIKGEKQKEKERK